MTYRHASRLGAIALTCLATLPAAAAGQTDESTVDLSVHAGPTMPASDLADITDVGPAVGADIAFWINDHLAVTVDGSVDMLRGDDRADALPDVQLWHYGAGLETNVMPVSSPVTFELMGGAGATELRTNHFDPTGPGAPDRLQETYFGLNAGAEAGYQVSDNIDVALRGGAFFTFTDATDLRPLSDMAPQVDGFDSMVTLPLTLQVDVGLN
ncbi:MAG: outer membrane beta-barrel protein [Gemmatimonadota bacterium]|jgi:hypothetical protein